MFSLVETFPDLLKPVLPFPLVMDNPLTSQTSVSHKSHVLVHTITSSLLTSYKPCAIHKSKKGACQNICGCFCRAAPGFSRVCYKM